MKSIISTNWLLIIASFFLTFCNFKCNNETVETIKGIDLVVGKSVKKELVHHSENPNASQQPDKQKLKPEPYAIVAFGSAILGLIFIFIFGNRLKYVFGLILGLIGIYGIYLIKYKIEMKLNNSEMQLIIPEFAEGYWVLLGGFGLVVVLNLLAIFIHKIKKNIPKAGLLILFAMSFGNSNAQTKYWKPLGEKETMPTLGQIKKSLFDNKNRLIILGNELFIKENNNWLKLPKIPSDFLNNNNTFDNINSFELDTSGNVFLYGTLYTIDSFPAMLIWNYDKWSVKKVTNDTNFKLKGIELSIIDSNSYYFSAYNTNKPEVYLVDNGYQIQKGELDSARNSIENVTKIIYSNNKIYAFFTDGGVKDIAMFDGIKWINLELPRFINSLIDMQVFNNQLYIVFYTTKDLQNYNTELWTIKANSWQQITAGFDKSITMTNGELSVFISRLLISKSNLYATGEFSILNNHKNIAQINNDSLQTCFNLPINEESYYYLIDNSDNLFYAKNELFTWDSSKWTGEFPK